MATLEIYPEANCDRQTSRQADRRTKSLIGARATALPQKAMKKVSFNLGSGGQNKNFIKKNGKNISPSGEKYWVSVIHGVFWSTELSKAELSQQGLEPGAEIKPQRLFRWWGGGGMKG